MVDAQGNEVGVVGQGSRIFARGLDDKGTLTVRWNDASDQICSIQYTLPNAKHSSAKRGVRQLYSTCVAGQ
ncbi:FimD/PapC C-terminal domain-containing protein [Burkholderia stagnalis]|uniref:FimD/PapC C-terminal domain-containing protein n=1 Tax=Burkholderia stagnalis TaxID=1503054 RepID=UPI00289301EF|nr:FimD/PapC C-terminal domain-containing protein [Burkholderia stagnalis]